MLASLKNIFAPQHIAETMKLMDPMKSTVMDTFFKNRINHQSPMIGLADVTEVTRTVPVVRRDGNPISLGNEEFSAQFFAPLPIKPSVNVSASELNDLSAFMQNPQAVAAWRKRKLEQLRRTIRNTTEGLCSVILTTGKYSWPVQLEGGRTETYEVDFGAIPAHALNAKITAQSTLSEVYGLLEDMAEKINHNGFGGKIEFWAGKNVIRTLLDLGDASRTTMGKNPISISFSEGKVAVGDYIIHALNETYPSPVASAQWAPKLGAKQLLAVAIENQGSIYYCAIDSISANNVATPLHVVPVAKADDSGISLIGQSKPFPVRPSKASCLCDAVV